MSHCPIHRITLKFIALGSAFSFDLSLPLFVERSLSFVTNDIIFIETLSIYFFIFRRTILPSLWERGADELHDSMTKMHVSRQIHSFKTSLSLYETRNSILILISAATISSRFSSFPIFLCVFRTLFLYVFSLALLRASAVQRLGLFSAQTRYEVRERCADDCTTTTEKRRKNIPSKSTSTFASEKLLSLSISFYALVHSIHSEPKLIV